MVIPNSTGYDGQMYRVIAHDPFLREGYQQYLDLPRLRYRRILISVLAWAFAFGSSNAIDAAYIGVMLLFVFLGVFWCAGYFELRKSPPALGLMFLLVPATLTSVDRLLLDGPLTALAAGFFLADLRGSRELRWWTSTLAGLVKETGLALVLAAVVAHLYRRQYRDAVISAAGAIPALLWFGYVETRTVSPEPAHIFTIPFAGIIRRFFIFRMLSDPLLQSAFRVVDLIAIAGYALSLWLAWRWIRKDGLSATTIAASFFLALATVLGSRNHMMDAYGYARPVSPMLLYVMLRAAASRRWHQLVPPLMVTLSILIYFAKPLIGILKGIVS